MLSRAYPAHRKRAVSLGICTLVISPALWNTISVQNRVRPEKVYDAFYKLSDPMQQIQAYVEQVILGYETRSC